MRIIRKDITVIWQKCHNYVKYCKKKGKMRGLICKKKWLNERVVFTQPTCDIICSIAWM